MDEIHLFQADFVIGKSGKPMLVDEKLVNFNLNLIKTKKFDNNYYYKYSK